MMNPLYKKIKPYAKTFCVDDKSERFLKESGFRFYNLRLGYLSNGFLRINVSFVSDSIHTSLSPVFKYAKFGGCGSSNYNRNHSEYALFDFVDNNQTMASIEIGIQHIPNNIFVTNKYYPHYLFFENYKYQIGVFFAPSNYYDEQKTKQLYKFNRKFIDIK